MIRKFLNFITFVDLPIRKKFTLFSLGVLFWFLVMYVVSIAANITVNNQTDRILNNVISHDKATQTIIRKLQSLSIDASEILNISDVKTLNRKTEASKARIKDIKEFSSILVLGGRIIDIDRDKGGLIESFVVSGSDENLKAKEYTDSINPMVKELDSNLSGIKALKTEIINGSTGKSSLLTEQVNGYKDILAGMHTLSFQHSADISKLYATNFQKIREINNLILFVFSGILVVATSLLILFTITISNSTASLIKSIIDQIRALGTGKIGLTKKIDVKSKDEIGTLSEEFNNLTEEIHEMVMFKKVIEEDDTLEDVYSRLGRIFSEKFGLNEYIIYEIPNNQNKMEPVYPVMLHEKEIYCNEEILTNCNLCKVEKTGHEISSMTYPEICKQFRKDLNREHICFPMIISGKTGGVVQFLLDKQGLDDNSDKRLFKAEQYIKESQSVIEAKRLTNTLRESALKDSLTGLYNRRFLQEYTETLIAGVLRRKKIVGLIMCDLDFFKQVNDHYGHNVGDAVLKETAHTIKKCVRSADMVIRFGGEEFLVVMLDTDGGETLKVAEKIRSAIENNKIKVPDGTIKKTISLGVSEFPKDSESFWQTIKFADVALYKAKEQGRNRAVRFTDEMWSENSF